MAPTLVFLLGKFCGRKSLVGYSPWVYKESHTTEHVLMHNSTIKHCQLYARTCQNFMKELIIGVWNCITIYRDIYNVISWKNKAIILKEIELEVRLLVILKSDFILIDNCSYGFPKWHGGKGSAYQCRRHEFNLWVRNIPWRRKWQPTSVFLSGKFSGQRSLAGYSPWDRKEFDMAEHAHMHTLLFLKQKNRMSGKSTYWTPF